MRISLFVFIFLVIFKSIGQINTPRGAVVPFNSNLNYGTNGIMPSNLPLNGVYGKSQDAANAYLEWKSNYTETCGNGIRVKFDDPGSAISEGIGYGMLLAAYSADKQLFDGLYRYYNSNLDKNGLMNWKIDGCADVSGENSATDADLDVAFALLIARNQWPAYTIPYSYENEANKLLGKIKNLEISKSGQATNGDGWGFKDGCRNISYQSPAYYKTFAITNVANTATWNNAVTGAYKLILANAHSTTGLVSDWADSTGKMNTCNPGGLAYAATSGYGYDACRSVLRLTADLLWNGDQDAKNILKRIATYISANGASGVGGPLNQDGSKYSGWAHNAVFVSSFSAAAMGSGNQALLNSMYLETNTVKDKIQKATPSGFYGNTMRCLSLFMLTGNFWKYGTTSDKEINVRKDTSTILTHATFDFGYNQIVTGNPAGKTVLFTVENLGYANLLLGPQPDLSLSCPDNFEISAQPQLNSLGLADSTVFSLTFRPLVIGPDTCTLVLKNNDIDESNYTIYLKGVGSRNPTYSQITVLDTINVVGNNGTLSFGAFTTGFRGYKLLKIRNSGTASLNITSGVLTGAGFTFIEPSDFAVPFVVPPGRSRLITIGFSSNTSIANVNGMFTFNTDDEGNPSYTFQLKAAAFFCSANPTSKTLWDFDGHKNIVQPFLPNGQWITNLTNTLKNGTNPSPVMARYGRPKSGDNDVIRFYNCGAKTVFTAWPPSAAELPSFAFNADNATLRVLMFSPAAGIEVKLSPKKPDPAASRTSPGWLPVISDFSSDVIKKTTRANQWEEILFDLSKVISGGLTSDVKVLDIMVDPLGKHASLPSSDTLKRTFYLDRIMYGPNPCLSDGSGILNDYDSHINISLDKDVPAFSELVINPVPDAANNSANVAVFTKSSGSAPGSDLIRYNGCANRLNLSRRKFISMLVYAPFEGKTIRISAKVPDGSDAGTEPDDIVSAVQLTTRANKWVRLYFDLSSVPATDISRVFGFDMVIDPSQNPEAGNYYIDDIRNETGLPCTSNIGSSGILNDFNLNRNIDLANSPKGTYNDETLNPNPVINTSTGVAEFIRAEDGDPMINGLQADVLRFLACGSKLDISKGRSVLSVQVLAPATGTEVRMILRKANGTEISRQNVKMKNAGAWETLNFDFSDNISDTTASFVELVLDPASVNITSAAARTYFIDNLRYTTLPEINLKQSNANLLTGDTLDFGTLILDDSISVDVALYNNGGAKLTLTGTQTGVFKITGTDSLNFIPGVTPQFTNSISKASATGFTIKFKPVSSGEKLAILTIKSNDFDEPVYTVYLKGTVTCPIIPIPFVPVTDTSYCISSLPDSLRAMKSGIHKLKWYGDTLTDTFSVSFPVPVTVRTGDTTIYVSQGSRGCESARVPVKITISPKPIITITGQLEICKGDTSVLLAGGGDSYAWQKGPDTARYKVFPSADQKYVVKGTNLATTCSDTSSVTVRIVKGNLKIEGNRNVCPDQATGLPYRALPQTTDRLYSWSVTGDANVSGNTDALLNFGNDTIITLTVAPLASNGKRCMDLKDSLIIQKYTGFKGAIILDKDTTCVQGEINASVKNIAPNATLKWYAPEGSSIRFSDKANGTKAIVTLGGKGGFITVMPVFTCPGNVNADSARIVVLPNPEVYAGEDQVHEGLLITFTLQGIHKNSEAGTEYSSQWINLQGTSAIYNSFSINTSVLPKDPVTDYVLKISIKDYACFGSDTVTVSFKGNIKPPLMFSPNNDDKNDVWSIPGLALFPDVKVEVFNQWGTVVYTKNRMYHLDPWSGKSDSGHELPVATYYYIITPNFHDYKPFSGSVTIVR